ncbi:OmpA family protein [Halomonas sp.]|uniref:OmpA family protein n=1 Tax=Halomonas sp. TaxID=1486246 RepID=UPI0026200AFD|nr:OmpA family protein [Halomonas sp.]
MKKSTTGLLLGSALVVGLSGCATSNTSTTSSDKPWYQHPMVCGLAGGVIGGGIGYASSSESDEDDGAAIGATAGATIGAMLCADSPEPVVEPEPMPEPEPEPVEFEPVTLQSDVTFAFDSAELRPGAEYELNEVAATLNNNPEVRVTIAGHTDSIGSNEYNLGLSERRAESVRDYLVSQGVADGRMRTVGYGEERPVATNETDEGRAMNRRVEIMSQ